MSNKADTNGINADLARQNFSQVAEDGLNDQIQAELEAGYVYQTLHAYFDRDDVALPGIASFFKKSMEEEREHAQKLVEYLNSRGGRVEFRPIHPPTSQDQDLSNTTYPALTAFQKAQQLEKAVNQKLLDLHKIADQAGDAQMCDYLEGEFLNEQVEAIKDLADKITNIKRVGDGLGIYLFDQKLS